MAALLFSVGSGCRIGCIRRLTALSLLQAANDGEVAHAAASVSQGDTAYADAQHTEDSSETGQAETCPIGTILCPDTNTCRDNCHTESPKSDENDSGTLSSNFAVDIHTIPAVEKPKGTAAQYGHMAEHLNEEATAIKGSLTGASEAISATSAVAGENSHAAEEKSMELMKTNVEMDMQIAAKDAAIFADANKHHQDTVHLLKEARKNVAFQETVVEKAKKALENEEKKLKDLKAKADDARQVEESAKISAEQAGDHYVDAKTKAITADKELNEEQLKVQRQEELKKAVEKTTQEELKHFAEEDASKAAAAEAHQHGLDAGKKADVPPKVEEHKEEHKEHKEEHKKPECKNCDTLSPEEQAQNPQASCADCDGWAAEGQCHQAEFKEFMHKNCAKSCGVGACKASDIPAAAKPATTAAAEPAKTAAAEPAKKAADAKGEVHKL